MRITPKCFVRGGLNEQPYIDGGAMRLRTGEVNGKSDGLKAIRHFAHSFRP